MNIVISFGIILASFTFLRVCVCSDNKEMKVPWIWPDDSKEPPKYRGSLCSDEHCSTLSNVDETKVKLDLTKPKDDFFADFCNQQLIKPNYTKSDRRVSEAKCFDYAWDRKIKKNEEIKNILCHGFLGLKSYNNRKYIIGGRNAKERQFPHMGAVGWSRRNGTISFKCGCTLISPNFAVTAAHCSKIPLDADLLNGEPDIVRLGTTVTDDLVIEDIEENEHANNKNVVDAKILRVIVHPLYSPPKRYNDIALIELVDSQQFTHNIQPACLWIKPDVAKGLVATVTGWGVIETETNRVSSVLQEANIEIIDSDLCDVLLKPSCNRRWCGIKEHQICAGKLSGGVDTCQGDSGGPLQIKVHYQGVEEESFYSVIGITSFGVGCARPNLPGVYTRVSSFIDWIEGIVWALG